MASDLKIMHKTEKRKKNNFLREVQNEFKKITWTTKAELILSTKIVLTGIFVFAIAIYFSDIIIRSALNLINVFAKIILG
ncbi:MAG: Protein translocase subunit SecE [Candidatus Anoxychlamydiales bacterium]|nr:Protein translocase subunit SecE [Candidatus Anoxychlamydiales bacterium]